MNSYQGMSVAFCFALSYRANRPLADILRQIWHICFGSTVHPLRLTSLPVSLTPQAAARHIRNRRKVEPHERLLFGAVAIRRGRVVYHKTSFLHSFFSSPPKFWLKQT
jgi:hypothetical protein